MTEIMPGLGTSNCGPARLVLVEPVKGNDVSCVTQYSFNDAPDGWFMHNGIKRQVIGGNLVPLTENEWQRVVADLRDFYTETK